MEAPACTFRVGQTWGPTVGCERNAVAKVVPCCVLQPGLQPAVDHREDVGSVCCVIDCKRGLDEVEDPELRVPLWKKKKKTTARFFGWVFSFSMQNDGLPRQARDEEKGKWD